MTNRTALGAAVLLAALVPLLLPARSHAVRLLGADGTVREGGPLPGQLREEGAPGSASRGIPPSVAELKNGDFLSVSVPLGTDNGVAPSSDFRLLLPGGRSLLLYPAELYERRFWSQPLAEGDFAAVLPGAPVEPALLSAEEHGAIRAEGERRRREAAARREEERREGIRKEVAALEADRLRLLDRRDDLERRVAAAEQAAAREEEALFRRDDSDRSEADRVRVEIDDLTDRRQELSDRRTTLAIEGGPSAKREAERLTREIRDLTNRISADRDRLRTIADRMRGNRESWERASRELRSLLAERRALDGEIRAAERKIADRERDLSRPLPR